MPKGRFRHEPHGPGTGQRPPPTDPKPAKKTTGGRKRKAT